MLFKAHKSNYVIRGFTKEVSLNELAELGRKHKLPVVYDMGSGLLRKTSIPLLAEEPDVRETLKTGIDLLILLHWNRHETTEPALELARKYEIPARTVHYAGFTSLQVSLTEMLTRVASAQEPATTGGGKGGRKR